MRDSAGDYCRGGSYRETKGFTGIKRMYRVRGLGFRGKVPSACVSEMWRTIVMISVLGKCISYVGIRYILGLSG